MKVNKVVVVNQTKEDKVDRINIEEESQISVNQLHCQGDLLQDDSILGPSVFQKDGLVGSQD